MRELFKGFYQPTRDDFEELWKSATFVFDTSILLNLYRFPQQARDDLLNAMQTFSDRCWIPFQVALEFQRNRVSVILDQKKRFREVGKIIESNLTSLKEGLGKLQLRERHSTINVDGFLFDIQDRTEKFLNELNILESQQSDSFANDPIRERIESLFKGKVGKGPGSQTELDGIYEIGKKRFASSTPPGYMDQNKAKGSDSDFYTFGSCTYQRKYGDFLLWKQIIEFAKETKLKHLIFVTDDDKEDWWWVIQSNGPKTVGPRPELVQEISTESDVETFYMYNSERFLQRTADFLKLPSNEQSIKQVKDVKRVASLLEFAERESQVNIAVTEWLSSNFPGIGPGVGDGGAEHVVESDNGKMTIVEVVRGRTVESTWKLLRTLRKNKLPVMSSNGCPKFVYLIVLDCMQLAEDFCSRYGKIGDYLPENDCIIVTYILRIDGEVKLGKFAEYNCG